MILHLGRNLKIMSNIVIGIEGLVGAGKTSICRKLTEIIPNTVMFNGGNLYRAIVYGLMKSGNPPSSNWRNSQTACMYL